MKQITNSDGLDPVSEALNWFQDQQSTVLRLSFH